MTNLADDIERLRIKISDTAWASRQKRQQRKAARVQRDVTALHVFVYQVVRALLWIRGVILAPIFRWLMVPLRYLWGRYRRLWDWVVYTKNEFGDLEFSKVRAGLFVLASVTFLTIVDDIALFVVDVGLYAATVRHSEPVYLTNSQEILPKDNIHSAQGCDALPCTDHNSIYFRIRPNFFNHAWSVVHTGNIFFPDFVAAAIPPGASRCAATSYGVRWKFIMRGFDVYPDMLAVSCTPIQSSVAP